MKVLRRVALGFVAYLAVSAASAFLIRRLFPENADPQAQSLALVASMDGRDFLSVAKGLHSVSVLAYMGGVQLDLTEAEIVDGAVLEAKAIMGGIDVIVPQGWRVESTDSAMFGGFVNGTDPDAAGDDAPLLVVDARLVMGGMAVRYAEDPDGR